MALEIFGVVNPVVSEMFTAMVAKSKDALLGKVNPWARLISGFTSTSSLRLKYPIDLTSLDGFREWIGERDIKDSDIAAYFIDSKPWERSIHISVDVANQPGDAQAYVNKVPALMQNAEKHPNKLVKDLLINGKTIECWDEKMFFATDHPVNTRDPSKGTYSNLMTASPFSRANFKLAKARHRSFKAPDGQTSLGCYVTHVLGPTDLEEDFDQLFKKKILANDAGNAADDNIYYQGAEPIIASELDEEPGVWYSLGLGMPGIRPFEIQMANNGSPDIKILGDGTEHATKTNYMLFAGKLFGNAGVSIPFTIVRHEP